MSSVSPETEQTDEQLAAAIARRSESPAEWQMAQQHFEVLYARHAGKMLSFLAARVRRSDVDDVHQAVWERVWQYLPDRFTGGNFRAWLHRIARNYIIDRSRRRTADQLEEESRFSDPRTTRPDDALVETERMQALEGCLQKLDNLSAALVRARLGGEDYSTLCERLELASARAHKLFHQAKVQLANCVKRALE